MKLAKTALGVQAMKDRSVPLTPRQRSAFILFDGRRTRDDVLAATAGMGVLPADVDAMVEAGLLTADPALLPQEAAGVSADVAPTARGAPMADTPHAAAVRTPQQRYTDAYPIATRLTSGLGLRGFRLNLALEAASGFDDLLQLAPKIRDAVGAEKYAPLDLALHG